MPKLGGSTTKARMPVAEQTKHEQKKLG